jgi:glycerol-3-phosphate dehydrogenase
MKLRETNIKKIGSTTFDVLIIGGGINGAVSAASLSAKGVKTALIEASDFASLTSQESSNLAWGGIKYLESMEFFLVRKLCMCRNHLIRNYPSTVKEIRFFTTIVKGFRHPPFLIWLGTWLYWFIGSCFTRIPRYLTKKKIQRKEKIINVENAAGGFEYSDAYLYDNDARFVYGFIRAALTTGCIAVNYVSALNSYRNSEGIWVTNVKNMITNKVFEVRSRAIINATGPLADSFNEKTKQSTKHHLVLSKGIHLIVDKLSKNKKVLTFFATDGRLFFVIPMGRRTCIGTTDTIVEAPTNEVTAEDRSFVLENINNRLKLKSPLTEKDIISERCGVRPLVTKGRQDAPSDWTQMSRKHVIETNTTDNYITIFGGKLTDCLNVGDEVCESIEQLGIEVPDKHYKWYGEPERRVRERFMHLAKLTGLDKYTAKESSEQLSTRLWRRYGSTAFSLLEMIQEDPSQAEVLIKGTEYIRCELREAASREMIVKLSDFLRRRSKIALIERKETIQKSAGLYEACQILFGDQAKEKMDEYFH